ncbi:MAG TPA: SDR family oxidoreductase [Candidatus Dormibacteraeota bacterium]|jgi:dTDP-4-dehydrorhamnose reductase|nr:SDR family oxidoreductase [Candidatus Dormibacteraeota bacterium]
MILVTGASGLLGASLVSQAHKRNREVVGLYHRHPVHIDGVKLLAADLTDQAETTRIFQELRPSSVVHCAAATDVDWCEDHPGEAHRVNVMAPATIAAVSSRSGARLIYISTDSVFDGARGNYVETDTPGPVNVYARTKLQGEREVVRQNPAALIARVNFYGWNAQNKHSLAEWILKQLTLGRRVPGFSDVVFCPVLAHDLAEVMLALLDKNLAGLYHVVGSEAVSKYEFAKRVASMFGFDPGQVVPTHLADATLKAQRPLDTSLNTERICAALGRPMPDVEAGLRRFAQLRENGHTHRTKIP